jgi:hypothetical protein
MLIVLLRKTSKLMRVLRPLRVITSILRQILIAGKGKKLKSRRYGARRRGKRGPRCRRPVRLSYNED